MIMINATTTLDPGSLTIFLDSWQVIDLIVCGFNTTTFLLYVSRQSLKHFLIRFLLLMQKVLNIKQEKLRCCFPSILPNDPITLAYFSTHSIYFPSYLNISSKTD